MLRQRIGRYLRGLRGIVFALLALSMSAWAALVSVMCLVTFVTVVASVALLSFDAPFPIQTDHIFVDDQSSDVVLKPAAVVVPLSFRHPRAGGIPTVVAPVDFDDIFRQLRIQNTDALDIFFTTSLASVPSNERLTMFSVHGTICPHSQKHHNNEQLVLHADIFIPRKLRPSKVPPVSPYDAMSWSGSDSQQTCGQLARTTRSPTPPPSVLYAASSVAHRENNIRRDRSGVSEATRAAASALASAPHISATCAHEAAEWAATAVSSVVNAALWAPRVALHAMFGAMWGVARVTRSVVDTTMIAWDDPLAALSLGRGLAAGGGSSSHRRDDDDDDDDFAGGAGGNSLVTAVGDAYVLWPVPAAVSAAERRAPRRAKTVLSLLLSAPRRALLRNVRYVHHDGDVEREVDDDSLRVAPWRAPRHSGVMGRRIVVPHWCLRQYYHVGGGGSGHGGPASRAATTTPTDAEGEPRCTLHIDVAPMEPNTRGPILTAAAVVFVPHPQARPERHAADDGTVVVRVGGAHGSAAPATDGRDGADSRAAAESPEACAAADAAAAVGVVAVAVAHWFALLVVHVCTAAVRAAAIGTVGIGLAAVTGISIAARIESVVTTAAAGVGDALAPPDGDGAEGPQGGRALRVVSRAAVWATACVVTLFALPMCYLVAHVTIDWALGPVVRAAGSFGVFATATAWRWAGAMPSALTAAMYASMTVGLLGGAAVALLLAALLLWQMVAGLAAR